MVTACKNQPAKIHEAELKTPRKAVSFLGHFLLHMAQGLSCWITFTAIQIAFFLKAGDTKDDWHASWTPKNFMLVHFMGLY